MRDAQVLILDEPTASLDARAEYEVFQRFADLTHGKMAVLISHRFSTVRMADRILVLEGRPNPGTGQPPATGRPGRTVRGVVRVAGAGLPLIRTFRPTLEFVDDSNDRDSESSF